MIATTEELTVKLFSKLE